MMRLDGLFEQVCAFDTLLVAWKRARRGKRTRSYVARFEFALERELMSLRRDLLAGSYAPGPLSTFTITDPKERLIAAAPFRDRVLHHAIVIAIEPHLERRFDPDSYACRKGRGVDAALRRARALTKPSTWVLRSDITRCYPSLDHAVLFTLLRRTFTDERLIALLERIVTTGAPGGRGLPIGNLTSQWLANLYLDRIDHHVRHVLKPRGYLRYMDDFALLDPDRDKLKSLRAELEIHVRDTLRLALNERVTQLHEARRGWPFLGFRVLPHGLQVRRETWRRFVRRARERHHRLRRGRLTTLEVASAVRSMIAHLDRAAHAPWRRARRMVQEL